MVTGLIACSVSPSCDLEYKQQQELNMATQHETKTPTINQTTLKRGIKIMKILTEQISGSFRLNATTLIYYTGARVSCNDINKSDRCNRGQPAHSKQINEAYTRKHANTSWNCAF